jgi:hypothetical protein
MNATELLNKYNNDYNQLVSTYNKSVLSILKLKIGNRIKQSYLNNLTREFKYKLELIKKKYQADLAAINNTINNAINNAINTTKVKKALMIGINYTGTDSQLNGCINDIHNVSSLLISKYAFKPENITKITDETTDKPTRNVILSSFETFLKSGNEGDLLFFSYSGHGSTTIDFNNNEKTGNDEMIISIDSKGILDDELKSLIQQHLKKNVTLFALFDCCFSGTVLDLKYQYLDSLENNTSTVNKNETETYGNVIMISGCTDIQTSADAYLNKKYQGAMTWSFLSALSVPSPSLTWRDLLIKMRDQLKSSAFDQLPQLSSGQLMDINTLLCF